MPMMKQDNMNCLANGLFWLDDSNLYLIQDSPAIKKCVASKAIVKKDVKSKVAAKKWL